MKLFWLLFSADSTLGFYNLLVLRVKFRSSNMTSKIEWHTGFNFYDRRPGNDHLFFSNFIQTRSSFLFGIVLG